MKLTLTGDTTSLTYWDGTDPVCSILDLLQDKLIPSNGEASTEHGEALRCCTRIIYDVYNNGGGNLGEIEYYIDMLRVFRAYFSKIVTDVAEKEPVARAINLVVTAIETHREMDESYCSDTDEDHFADVTDYDEDAAFQQALGLMTDWAIKNALLQERVKV